jgi:hypothetical protein
VFPIDADSTEALCANAESAHEGKADRQPLSFYAPDMNARVAESLAMENRLRRALTTARSRCTTSRRSTSRPARCARGAYPLERRELGSVPPRVSSRS